MTSTIFNISSEIRSLCRKFAAEVVSSNLDEYAKRNQRNSALIQQQIYEGKLAEFIVWEFYNNIGVRCSKPDIKIYYEHNKSFDADLVADSPSGKVNIHVKSQNHESAKRYGNSWLFQKKDPLVLGKNINDMCVFCSTGRDFVDIKMIIKASELIFKEPKLDKLKGSKVAIYLEDYV